MIRCIDCKYYSDLGFCKAPENGISMVNGEPTPMFASERRSAGKSLLFSGIRCGPDAINFVSKENTKLSLLQRILRKI